MTAPAGAYFIDGHAAPRDAFYAAACEPSRSAAVEACAGAGKTWMLVSRILRALLDGAAPQEILAITFTRKAAGEMRARLQEWLALYADPATTDADCRAALVARGVPADRAAALVPRLRSLRGELLAQGRTVQVLTFHAWFSQLLRMAPMAALAELEIAPQATLIEDESELHGELMRAFQARVVADAGLRADHAALTLAVGRSTLAHWLLAALERRSEIALAGADAESGVAPAAIAFPECAGLDPPAALLGLPLMRARMDEALRALGRESGKKAQGAAQGIERAVAALETPQVALDTLQSALFNRDGDPRKLALKDGTAVEALVDSVRTVQACVAQHEAHLEHLRMLRLARVLIDEFTQLKRRRGLVDMPDLERVALALLGDAACAGWIAERLDARLRHLLIDEFQDTSPLQWHALVQWLSGYAGAGGGGRAPLSVFIVGDPKQSIYRFRRAEPRVFATAQQFVVHGLGGRALACDHTRRNAPQVLQALNAVFDVAAREDGYGGFRAHTTEVTEPGAGLLMLAGGAASAGAAAGEATDAESGDATGEATEGATKGATTGAPAGVAALPTAWRELLLAPRRAAEERRARVEAGQVADAIAQWVRDGLAPGEVQVLARKRRPLALVAEALQARQVPFAQAEDLALAENVEACDVLALLDVLASPAQDLSFARALRSPIWGADDADLLWLATRARALAMPWWPALRRLADDGAEGLPRCLAEAHAALARWSALEPHLPPHDLLDRIYSESDLLARYAAAVPPARRPTALAALRALLAQTLALDGGRYASIYGFVRALRAKAHKVALAPPPGAVQLLTIHGAKGLESHTVFLMDTRARVRQPESGIVLVDWPVEAPRPARVAFARNEKAAAPSLGDLVAQEQQARALEELNALYVAMSRAKARLVVSHTAVAGAPQRSWWSRLEPLATALVPEPAPAADGDGDAPAPDPVIPEDRLAPPAGAGGPPAGTAAADTPAERRVMRIGEAFHRLMQWCCDLPADAASAAPDDACVAAAAREFGLGPAEAAQAGAAARAVLASPAFARFRGGASLAWAGNEVPVAADAGAGAVGRIDRLVALDEGGSRCWWVLDYKLEAAPQHDPAHAAQLAAYVAAVRRLNPGDVVRAALVGADGSVHPLP